MNFKKIFFLLTFLCAYFAFKERRACLWDDIKFYCLLHCSPNSAPPQQDVLLLATSSSSQPKKFRFFEAICHPKLASKVPITWTPFDGTSKLFQPSDGYCRFGRQMTSQQKSRCIRAWKTPSIKRWQRLPYTRISYFYRFGDVVICHWCDELFKELIAREPLWHEAHLKSCFSVWLMPKTVQIAF
jgi:hypothetical protein